MSKIYCKIRGRLTVEKTYKIQKVLNELRKIGEADVYSDDSVHLTSECKEVVRT